MKERHQAGMSDLVSDLSSETPTLKIGERIRLLRDKKNLSQKKAALEIGIALSTMQSYERGNIPKGDHLIKLCSFFKVSSDWILFGKEAVVPKEGQKGQERQADSGKAEIRQEQVPVYNDKGGLSCREEREPQNEQGQKISGEWGLGKTRDHFFLAMLEELRSDKEYLRRDNQLLREKIDSDKKTIASLAHENSQLKIDLANCSSMLDMCKERLPQKEKIKFNKEFPVEILKMSKTLDALQKELKLVRQENKNLREEMQRDRDQDVAEDTG
jgi:transcriptional regulator with XRE-family HTH domain